MNDSVVFEGIREELIDFSKEAVQNWSRQSDLTLLERAKLLSLILCN